MPYLLEVPKRLEDKIYIDLKGQYYAITDLDEEESALLDKCRKFAKANPEWAAYGNYSQPLVASLYKARGLDRPAVVRTPLWKIVQDIGGRLHVAAGLARAPDYRSELDTLIRDRFGTRRAFCEATGIAEEMLSHVLSGRKDFSLATLSDALAKIGFGLHIAPVPSALEQS